MEAARTLYAIFRSNVPAGLPSLRYDGLTLFAHLHRPGYPLYAKYDSVGLYKVRRQAICV